MKKIALVTALAFMFGAYLYGDEDEREYEYKKKYEKEYRKYKKEDEEYKYKKMGWLSTSEDTKAAKLYKQECGSCHMAYQAEFLPKRSWKKLMEPKSLEDHFGVDATLDEEDRRVILEFLLKHAGDAKRVYGEYKEFIESIRKDSTPLRISEVPYFKKEHKKIPKKYIKQKEVKTIANCIACHKDAQEGIYDEDNIFIPNYGKWDD
ncbi:MAG: cytochrome C [Epsilonproteobacteria bacterium]|nr:cytochrome C [Campylobacterota bacterium]